MLQKEQSTKENYFQFKQFGLHQANCPMKVGTDGVLLGAWVNLGSAQRILDIGSGTGLIAIMLGQRSETAIIDAVEIEELSCQEAAANMAAAPWSHRLTAHAHSIQDFSKITTHTYDLIVSNPPFFSGGVLSDNLERTQVRHTVKLPHGDLLRSVRSLLSKEGRFGVILPYIEGLRFIELATQYKLYCNRQTEMHSVEGKPVTRLLLEFERQQKPIEQNTLFLRMADGTWSADYLNLVNDFYLDL